MDSTACLVWLDAGPDALHVDLSFQFPAVGQRDMEEDNPIACHLKFQVSLVAARFRFFRVREQGTHPRVRHFSLDWDARSRERFAGGIGQFEIERHRSDPRGLRRNLVLNRNKRRRFD